MASTGWEPSLATAVLLLLCLCSTQVHYSRASSHLPYQRQLLATDDSPNSYNESFNQVASPSSTSASATTGGISSEVNDDVDETTELGPTLRYIMTFKSNVTSQQDVEDICNAGKVPSSFLQEPLPSVCEDIIANMGSVGSPYCKRKYNMLLLGIALELHEMEVLDITLCLGTHVESFQLDSSVELLRTQGSTPIARVENDEKDRDSRRHLQQFQTSSSLGGDDSSIEQMAGAEVQWNLDRIDQELPQLDNVYGALGWNVQDDPSWHANTSGVRIYVVDSGILKTHNEFQFPDAEGSVFSTVSYGKDFVDDDDISEDCEGHGSHVAGIAGGKTVGVAPGVKLVSVRVLDCKGSGSVSDVVAALDWIAQDIQVQMSAYNIQQDQIEQGQVPADGQLLPLPRGIVVMSLGITAGSWSQQMEKAVANLVLLDDVAVVTAAGNSKGNTCNLAPANVPESITVSATNLNNKVNDPAGGPMFDLQYAWANYGPCIDLYAPGVDIYSACANPLDACYPTDAELTQQYKLSSGTSMSVPHVAGVLAMYLGMNPTISAPDVKELLLSKATVGQITDLSNNSPNKLLYSRLVDPPPSPPPPSPPPPSPAPFPPQITLDDTQSPTEIDTKAPTVKINGFVLAKYNKVPRNCPYLEKGAEASDAVDGDLTDEVQINASNVDTSTPGIYKVWYSVADSAGNTAKAYRSIKVLNNEMPCDTDVTQPILKTFGKLLAKHNVVEQCDQFTDPGAYATATDNIDTDEELTSMIVTAGMPVDTTVLGIHQITYQLSDSAGNSGGQKVRKVKVVASDKCPDTEPPIINIQGKFLAKFNQVTRCQEWIDPGVTVTDNVDSSETLQANLETVNIPLDTSQIGTFVIQYNVKDTAGNAAIQKSRKVKVVADANASC